MHQLTKMKHFKERLECWLFQEKFSEIVYGIGMSSLYLVMYLVYKNTKFPYVGDDKDIHW